MPGTLADLWTTSVWLESIHPLLQQAAVDQLLSTPVTQPHTHVPADTVLANPEAIEHELRQAATETSSEPIAIRDLSYEAHLIGPGHSVGLAYGTGQWIGWCVLAGAGAAAGSPSGMLSLHDPRAGSAAVDIPGALWGRPLTIKPAPGIAVVFPGWLSYSVTPTEPDHRFLLLTMTINALSQAA